jgi:hypothetical protein
MHYSKLNEGGENDLFNPKHLLDDDDDDEILKQFRTPNKRGSIKTGP